jgi:hypothetical protein
MSVALSGRGLLYVLPRAKALGNLLGHFTAGVYQLTRTPPVMARPNIGCGQLPTAFDDHRPVKLDWKCGGQCVRVQGKMPRSPRPGADRGYYGGYP